MSHNIPKMRRIPPYNLKLDLNYFHIFKLQTSSSLNFYIHIQRMNKVIIK